MIFLEENGIYLLFKDLSCSSLATQFCGWSIDPASTSLDYRATYI